MDDKWKWSIDGLVALLIASIAAASIAASVSENQAKGACDHWLFRLMAMHSLR